MKVEEEEEEEEKGEGREGGRRRRRRRRREAVRKSHNPSRGAPSRNAGVWLDYLKKIKQHFPTPTLQAQRPNLFLSPSSMWEKTINQRETDTVGI